MPTLANCKCNNYFYMVTFCFHFRFMFLFLYLPWSITRKLLLYWVYNYDEWVHFCIKIVLFSPCSNYCLVCWYWIIYFVNYKLSVSSYRKQQILRHIYFLSFSQNGLCFLLSVTIYLFRQWNVFLLLRDNICISFISNVVLVTNSCGYIDYNLVSRMML